MEQLYEEMITNMQPNSPSFKGQAGVVIARTQTPGGHAAHFLLAAQMLTECEHANFIIGSTDKSGEPRNPFSGDLREMIFREALTQETRWPKKHIDRLQIRQLRDLSDESDNSDTWGMYFWANAVSMLPSGINKFRVYYSDDISIIQSWLSTDFLKEHVDIRHLDRSDILGGLSGTKIREAIINNDIAYLQEFCPFATIRRLDAIRKTLIAAGTQ